MLQSYPDRCHHQLCRIKKAVDWGQFNLDLWLTLVSQEINPGGKKGLVILLIWQAVMYNGGDCCLQQKSAKNGTLIF